MPEQRGGIQPARGGEIAGERGELALVRCEDTARGAQGGLIVERLALAVQQLRSQRSVLLGCQPKSADAGMRLMVTGLVIVAVIAVAGGQASTGPRR